MKLVKFKEMSIVVIAILTVITILIHYVSGCDVCTIRNGTDVRSGLKPVLSSKEEQTYAIIPLILPSGIVAIAVIVFLKNKRRNNVLTGRSLAKEKQP